MHTEHRERTRRPPGYWKRAERLAAFASLAVLAGVLTFSAPVLSRAAGAAEAGLSRIGIVGAGHMGSGLARLWARAGYEVMISSRHPQQLESLAHSIGPNVKVGTPRQAATYGNVVVIAVPYGVEPQIGRELSPEMAGKVVIDIGNPYPKRDGSIAVLARREGTGVVDPRFFPGVQLVRAFNSTCYQTLSEDAHRPGERVGVPIASNSSHAIQVVSQLVRAAGFAPVVVGGLSTAKRFDVNTPTYCKVLTASQLSAALGLPAH